MLDVNLGTIIDMLWWCRTWLLNGTDLFRVKETSQETELELSKVLRAKLETKSHLHRQFSGILENL